MNPTTPTNDDLQHLKLLAIFHYVVAGLTALFACFPLIHLALGLMMIFWPEFLGGKEGDVPPAGIGWMFTCLGGAMFLLGQTVAVCIAVAGRYLARRKGYWFIVILACLECAIFPFGTVLGVFTIVVLSRESVKQLFGVGSPAPPLEQERAVP
jgi:vacuolar-type H+-ATPase subunit I/STV1